MATRTYVPVLGRRCFRATHAAAVRSYEGRAPLSPVLVRTAGDAGMHPPGQFRAGGWAGVKMASPHLIPNYGHGPLRLLRCAVRDVRSK